ncbi:MAG: hypothetical protein GXO74_06140 [Calditrichaeota bacterium]|nr:hypothetical protein [Calditrichota bacterium]
MGIKKMSVVSDTGPLLHLSEIGCAQLLLQFKKIYTPESVCDEYEKHKRTSDADVLNFKNVKHISVKESKLKDFIRQYNLGELHLGETECLYLCQNLSVDVILTDDLAVRDIASNMGITPVGSLGVIIKSYREKTISLPQAEKLIFDLYETSSLFVTRTIVELVIEELKKYEKSR